MSLYQINEGDHYASIMPSPHMGITKLTGTVKFKENCKYDFSNVAPCKNDANKLVGIGYGLWPNSHQIWSIRIGWRFNDTGQLIILLYAYVDGQRVNLKIGTSKSFKVETIYPFEIINDRLNRKAVIKFAEFELSCPFDKEPIAGYILKPYFGGQCEAPHDMNIELNYN